MKYRYVIYRIACAALAILAACWLYSLINWAQLANRSGPAEWLSALLNLVMAGAAVAAFITARSWLPQLTTQEGYKLAIRLVNDEFYRLSEKNPLMFNAGDVFNAAQSIVDEQEQEQEQEKREATRGLSTSIAKLDKVLVENRTRRDTIERALFQMKTYGLEIVPEKEQAMRSMQKSHRDAIVRGSSVLDAAKRHLEKREKLLKKTPLRNEREIFQQDMREQGEEMLEELARLSSSVREAWEIMHKAQAAFISGDHRIDTLFIVRKG